MKKIQIIIVATLVMVAVMIGIGKVSLGVGAIGATVVDVQLSRIADGSASWDSTQFCDTNADNIPDGVDNGNSLCASPSTNAGNDMSSTNGVVRTGDTIQYLALMNLNEKDSTNAYFTAELSDGTYWKTLPSECLTEGVTPVSNISLSGTILTCNLGFRQEGITSSIMLYATVKGNVLNNTIVSAQITNAQADGSNVDSTAKINTLVTAGAKVDVEKKVYKAEDKLGPLGEAGKVITYSVTMKALKGSEALAPGDINLTDQFTMDLNRNSNTARLYTWDGGVACDINGQSGITIPTTPLGKPGLLVSTTDINGNVISYTSSNTNSTPNSGTWNCTETTPIGGNVDPHIFNIQVVAPDVSLSGVQPTEFANTGIINDGSYMLSGFIRVWVPFVDYEAAPNSSKNVLSTNTILDQTYTTISGLVSGEALLTNNSDNYGLANSLITGGAPGIPTQHIDIASFDTTASGSMKVFPGDLLTPVFAIDQQNRIENDTYSMQCIKFDNTQLQFNGWDVEGQNYINLVPTVFRNAGQTCLDGNGSSFGGDPNTWSCSPGEPGVYTAYANNPCTTSGWWGNPICDFGRDILASNTSNPSAFIEYNKNDVIYYKNDISSRLVVEYSTANTSGMSDDCGIANVAGTDNWTTVMPADLSTVTKIRIYFKKDLNLDYVNPHPGQLPVYSGFNPNGNVVSYDIFSNPNFIVKANPSGTVVPIYMSWSQNGGNNWQHPTSDFSPIYNYYQPNDSLTHIGVSDYVTIQNAAVRIEKVTTDLANDMKSYYNPGDTVNFQLQPTIGYPSPTAGTTTVTIVDTLPAGLSYLGINYDYTLGGTVAPLGETCTEAVSGQTITITCNDVVQTGAVGSLPYINMQAGIDPLATTATYVNTAVISSPADVDSSLESRTATRTVFTKLPGNLEIHKDVNTPLIPLNTEMEFTLTYQNNGTKDLTEIDMIDVLPWNGDNVRVDPQSDFTGILSYVSTTIDTTKFDIYYTKVSPGAINLDAYDISNAFPSTMWCIDYVTGGSCPANISEVTALRFKMKAAESIVTRTTSKIIQDYIVSKW
jgi:fimbrial isopeptide formation D2 family protein